MAGPRIAAIDVLGMGRLELLHPRAEIRLGCLQYEVKVIVEKAVREARPSLLRHCLAEIVDEPAFVAIVADDCAAAVPFRDDVMKCPCRFFSRSPRHGLRIAPQASLR